MYRGAPEEKRSGYDIAQICLNGHVTNSIAQARPSDNKKFCSQCGEPTTTTCQSCQHSIPGALYSPQMGKFSYSAPAYCIECGEPYPWTKRRLTAAKELAQEMEGLTAEERDLLTKSLDDLIRDTSHTPVAATRFKKLMAKVGGGAGKALYDVVVDIASETAKKAMGL